MTKLSDLNLKIVSYRQQIFLKWRLAFVNICSSENTRGIRVLPRNLHITRGVPFTIWWWWLRSGGNLPKTFLVLAMRWENENFLALIWSNSFGFSLPSFHNCPFGWWRRLYEDWLVGRDWQVTVIWKTDFHSVLA